MTCGRQPNAGYPRGRATVSGVLRAEDPARKGDESRMRGTPDAQSALYELRPRETTG